VKHDITAALSQWLSDGLDQIGQIRVVRSTNGYSLRHIADGDRTDLETFTAPEAARLLATYDDAGAYRPLRTAPNLKHGWVMNLPDVPSVRAALDHFYPSMLGVLRSYEHGTLKVTPLRETLDRQTGMYALTKKITDENAQNLVGRFCSSDGGCLKTILWPLAVGQPITTQPREKFDPAVNQTGTSTPCLPLLCHEACNLLVAEARSVVKKLQPWPPKTEQPAGSA
jgi:sirohydrochlorin cobaltochelatase